MDYETEEQQLEAIKKWWKENSTMVVTGIAVGVASIFGWQYYKTETMKHAEQASVLYEYVLVASDNMSVADEQVANVNQLQAEFSNTPYAALSALIVAKQQLASGNPEKAIKQYRWVIENAIQDELKYLAKIRLSRVLLTNQKQDEALGLLNEVYPESFNAMVLELKGDVLSVQGKKTAARESYIKAKALSKGTNRWLQLKIDDIGDTAVNTESATGTEPSA